MFIKNTLKKSGCVFIIFITILKPCLTTTSHPDTTYFSSLELRRIKKNPAKFLNLDKINERSEEEIGKIFSILLEKIKRSSKGDNKKSGNKSRAKLRA